MSRFLTRNCFLDGAIVFVMAVIVVGCGFVRVGMVWGGVVRSGAVLDGGCSGQLLGQISFSKENSDSAITNRSKQKEGASGEQVIEG